MIDLYHVYCINDEELQEITKTEVVGLQKLKYPIFLSLAFTTKEMNLATVGGKSKIC